MDQELKNLIKELIDDPKVRQQRQDSYKEALKFTKNEKERLELKLKEIRELKSLIPLYTKDATS